MTEKQFTTDYYNFIRDDRTYIKDNNVRMTYEQITDLLNSLSEENEQLKFQLKECREHKLFSRRELEKENEQLKSENQELKQYLSWQDMELEEMEDLND